MSIEGNQQKLTELEQSLVESLSQTFECNIGVARELFGRLLVGLKTWTTTERHIQQVFLEDVYSVLGFEEDIDDSQHRLAAPYPFLKVGRFFAKNLIRNFCRQRRKWFFFQEILVQERQVPSVICRQQQANVEDPCFGGVNLFNHLGGIHRLFHGNCQLVPSSIWREFFGCKPSDMSPYVWVNEDGDRILYFERIASPYREAIQESYVRQPILFRWVCNASWLEKVLRDNKLELWKVVSSEDYPAQ